MCPNHSDYIQSSLIPSIAASESHVEKYNIVHVLRQRGLIQEVTSDDLEKVSASESLSVYCGFDPTADSLHLGNLLGIIVLSWFQRCGHKPVVLLGGATGRVGDPSGRSTERPILTENEIENNVQGICLLITLPLSVFIQSTSPTAIILLKAKVFQISTRFMNMHAAVKNQIFHNEALYANDLLGRPPSSFLASCSHWLPS
jgi:tyrosyl-tRNA synthetase